MSKRIIIRIVLLVILAFGIFVFIPVVSLFIPRHGTVTKVSDLRKVFSKAGPQISATFTNSLTQKFPFAGPIEWKLILFKEPIIVLSGKVDTNSFRKYVSDHASTKFIWSGSGGEAEAGWPDEAVWPPIAWTSIHFRSDEVVQDYGASIQGKIDVRLQTVTITFSGSDEPVRASRKTLE